MFFTGNGSTGAIALFVHLMQLNARIRPALDSTFEPESAVVLVSAYEHHSNLLCWRESGALVVEIKEAPNGGIDLEDLQEQVNEVWVPTLRLRSVRFLGLFGLLIGGGENREKKSSVNSCCGLWGWGAGV